MTKELLIEINREGNIELPPEVQTLLNPGDKYMISLTEDSIILKKVHQDKVNLEQFFERLEAMEPDPNQPTLAEISQMIEEARQIRRANS
ncbi:hypothetical protein [Microcystis aeruginosa]|uniref:SpoVT-AbrB domain-containing protein n=1 Tax=Microcystis aeruginosa FD4 TaxID=2686288 RepID=A0A857D5J0_MICAE|nr:hypothetical protein [Microcystis aeruginosa]MDB9419169.1 hypothetical protein [Microcystis aeruginosa CS-563/04]QGZ90911.1 hypothetical protein GQR42_16730 [Microcystis aeruginosa FD4]